MPRKRGSARRRRRRGSLGPLLRVLSVVLAAVAIVAALTLFFKVDEVQVTGGGRYTEEEIRSASGVEQGDNLILLDKYRIAQRIYTALPYITEVRINRQLPDVLLVEVVETQAVADVQGAGGWWLVSPTGKVLEAVDSEAAQDYLILEGMTAQDPAAGERLTLSEEDNLDAETLISLLSAMETRGVLTRTDSVDASDPEQLVLDYDGRFRVEIGYDADFGFKMDCLVAAVATFQPNETGTIRMTMSNDSEVRFIPDGG